MKQDDRLPQAIRSEVKLRDGRNLSFVTFSTTEHPNDDIENPHPVLYFHGFVGCGVEGAWLADAVSKVGGKLHALDRPGFGYSDPFPANFTSQDRFETLSDDVFELAKHLKWKSFSLIGVSGGGPYILAILDAYLKKKASRQTEDLPKLCSIAHVCGVHSPAGSEGMLPLNVKLTEAIARNSLWSRIFVRAQFATMRAVFAILPDSLLLRSMKLARKDPNLPKIDALTMMVPRIAFNLLQVVRVGLRQGSFPALVEAQALFSKELPFAESLKQQYAQASDPPKVFIYQGYQDVNVPFHHGRFVHTNIFNEKSTYCELEKYGHMSLVVGEQGRIAKDLRSCF